MNKITAGVMILGLDFLILLVAMRLLPPCVSGIDGVLLAGGFISLWGGSLLAWHHLSTRSGESGWK